MYPIKKITLKMKELYYIFKMLSRIFFHLSNAHFFSGGPEYEDRNPQRIGAVRSLGPAKMAVRRVVV